MKYIVEHAVTVCGMCCFISALQLKGDDDYLEVEEVEEICKQLQPVWGKFDEFASYNGVPNCYDEEPKARYRGYVLIHEVLTSIMDNAGCIPKRRVLRALKAVDQNLAERWSHKRSG